MSAVEAGRKPDAMAYPASLEEAVARLRAMFRTEERETIADLPKEGLFDFLVKFCPLVAEWFGLDGRNTRLLAAMGTHDPDEASRRIVRALWRELRRERQA